ncbi:MAG TPA: hypothetical protein VM940_04390 [Chthoniobacterales bacterium]|nr:hypothetical protein [Chthoniobacterales bacterium]
MTWRQLSEDVAILSFPWRVFGIDFARNVTLLRLKDGRLVVHSTAAFTETDLAAIRGFGQPAWLVEATLLHDTFAKEGRAALPDIPYLAPEGFTAAAGITAATLEHAPSDWSGEIEVLRLEGTGKNEYVFLHRASRTLVVADLFFSFPPETRGWGRFFVRNVMRLPQLFGISIFFRRLMVRDRPAFERSLRVLLEWDFDRLIVAHREPLMTGAKPAVQQAIRHAGYLAD